MMAMKHFGEHGRFIEALKVTLTFLIVFLFSVPLSGITGTDSALLTLFGLATSGALYFFSFGETRAEQIRYFWLYALLLFCTVSLTVWMAGLATPYYIMVRSLFLFLCCCLGRYLPGGRMGGFFLIAFYLVLVMFFTPERIYGQEYEILRTSSIAIVFATVVYTVLTAWFPETPGFPAIRIRDVYLFKMALRMTLSLSAAFLISTLTGSSHASWICFSIMVTQGNLGETVKRAAERIAGTIAGIIAGTLIAILLFSQHRLSLYLDFVFLFFAYYFMKDRYWAVMIFATILITSFFYLFQFVETSIHAFLLARLLDTLLGIVLCLAGELILFPRSIFEEMRPVLFSLYAKLDGLLQAILTCEPPESLHEAWQQTFKEWERIAGKISLIKYEPLIYISKRCWMIRKIYRHLSEIIYLLYDKNHQNSALTPGEKEILGYLQRFIHVIKNFRPGIESSQRAGYIKTLEQQKTQLLQVKNGFMNRDLWCQSMFLAIFALTESYYRFLTIHPRAVQWKASDQEERENRVE